MIPAVNIILLLFAAAGFAGAGAALAVGRSHVVEEGERDAGMLVIAGVLAVFAAACTSSAAGVLGIIAYGGVVVWTSYVLCAHRMGVFRIAHFEAFESEHAER